MGKKLGIGDWNFSVYGTAATIFFKIATNNRIYHLNNLAEETPSCIEVQGVKTP